LAELAGWRERTLEPAADLAELKLRLGADDPDLGAALGAVGVQVAVDLVLRRGPCDLAHAAEVAFMPPMSGG
jgi:molybdopterin converting factor small subunit